MHMYFAVRQGSLSFVQTAILGQTGMRGERCSWDWHPFLPTSFSAPQLTVNSSEKPLQGLLWGCCLATGNLKIYQVKPTEDGSTVCSWSCYAAPITDEQKPGENKEVGILYCQQSWQPLSQNYLQQWFLGFPTAYFFPVNRERVGQNSLERSSVTCSFLPLSAIPCRVNGLGCGS